MKKSIKIILIIGGAIVLLALSRNVITKYEDRYRDITFEEDQSITDIESVDINQKETATARNWPGNYMFDYDKSWILETNGLQTYVKTKDYKRSSKSPLLETGAELSVVVRKDAGYEDLDTLFKDDSLLSGYAQNTRDTTVLGYPAYQYEINFEGVNATETAFLLWGDLYTLGIRYVNDVQKQPYLKDYTRLLETFEFIEK